MKIPVDESLLHHIVIYECQQTRTLEEAELSRNRVLLRAEDAQQLQRTLLEDFPEYGAKQTLFVEFPVEQGDQYDISGRYFIAMQKAVRGDHLCTVSRQICMLSDEVRNIASEIYQQHLSSAQIDYPATVKTALAIQLTHSHELKLLSECCQRTLLLGEGDGGYYLSSTQSEGHV